MLPITAGIKTTKIKNICFYANQILKITKTKIGLKK